MKIILNATRASAGELKQMFRALEDPEILKEKGGYIFRTALAANPTDSEKRKLHFSIKPALLEGERTFHYDLILPESIRWILSGCINSTGEIQLLFKPESRPLTSEALKGYRKLYSSLASFFLNGGYQGEGVFDMVTQLLIQDAGLFEPTPDNFRALNLILPCEQTP